MQITVIRKSDNSVITRIFEDEEGIKEITYEVLIEKDSNKRVPIYLDCC